MSGGDDARRVVGKYICSRYTCSKVSEVLTEMGGMCQEHASPLLFEIQRPWELRNIADRVPSFVPWEFIRPHERRARANHGGQTLARLSERGGLSLKESLAVVTGRDWYAVERLTREQAADEFLALLEAWRAPPV
jgi:hypothetical protein